MSCVYLLAASHSLPLYDSGISRLRTVKAGGMTVTVEEDGFSVQDHEYYRQAVDCLALDMQPCRYELNLYPTQEDAAQLRAYLSKNCARGETVEQACMVHGVEVEELLAKINASVAAAQ